ncbi:MAG: hypothetical protein RLZZ66_1249 [Pseudomonadota bacterium]
MKSKVLTVALMLTLPISAMADRHGHYGNYGRNGGYGGHHHNGGGRIVGLHRLLLVVSLLALHYMV